MSLPLIQAIYSEEKDKFILKRQVKTPELELPEGMISDGFSSPWYLRWYVNRVEQGWIAAWVHDWCYQQAYKSKPFADRLFYRNLRRCRVKKRKAKLMYLAVKFFGRGQYPQPNQPPNKPLLSGFFYGLSKCRKITS